jgi:(2Fe-2S) ferredoxin
MSNSHKTQISQFCLEGRFVDFVIKDGYKLKGLLLETIEGECYIKLAKHLRQSFDWRLAKGTLLQVLGEKKLDLETGEVKLKAERVLAARSGWETSAPVINPLPPEPLLADVKAARKATILVCQKSDCMKRGGKAVCQALEAGLSDRNLQDQVIIKGTGCMKNCKAGPNVVMPDKTRYTRLDAAQVPALIDKHFANSIEGKSREIMPSRS